MLQKERSFRYIKYLFVLLLFGMCTILFYRQTEPYSGLYISDLPEHISAGINNKSYSLLNITMGVLYRLTHSYISIALLESAIVIFTVLWAEKYIRRYFAMDKIQAFCIAVALLFLCSFYVPFPGQYIYKHSLVTQPWHNITYLGMRLFSIPIFFCTLEIIDCYKTNFTWKHWFQIAVPLLMGTSIKPSMMVDYSFALLCILIFDFISDVVKGRLTVDAFLRYVWLGTAVFPACAILLYQMLYLFGEQDGVSSSSGIAVVLLSSPFFADGCIQTIVRLIRETAFMVVCFIWMRKFFSKRDKFVYLLWIVTLFQIVILTETGPRAAHGNLTWGIHNVSYLLFAYLVPLFVKHVQSSPWKTKCRRDKRYTVICAVLLSMHLLTGIYYFSEILQGAFYYF